MKRDTDYNEVINEIEEDYDKVELTKDYGDFWTARIKEDGEWHKGIGQSLVEAFQESVMESKGINT